MHWIVAGLGFGDEGKGATVDFLARQGNKLVIRFNGGLQAGHNVVSGGIHHTFSQYASCLLVPGTRSILSRHVFVDPFAMQAEADHLKSKGITNLSSRAFASLDCVLVTPFHRTMNRVRELARGQNRHGSCGVGVGEAFRGLGTPLCMRLRDLSSPDLREKLELLRLAHLRDAREIAGSFAAGMADQKAMAEYIADLANPAAAAYIESRYAAFMESSSVQVIEDSRILDMISAEPAIFEGAQGFLLDMVHGFFPHVTPSRTDAAQALALIEEAGGAESCTLGVLRSYLTRHGEGPLPSESSAYEFAEPHNSGDSYQGRFRQGAFDVPLLQYALEKSIRVDALALTHLDRFSREWPVCTSYKGGPSTRPRAEALWQAKPEIEVKNREQIIELVEGWSGRPVILVSDGPGPEARTFRHSAVQSRNTFRREVLPQAPAHTVERPASG